MTAEKNATPLVFLLPSPGMGHLIPFAELAKKLVLHHNLTASLVTYSDFSSDLQLSFLSSLPAGIFTSPLPPVPQDDLPPDAQIVTRISNIIARSLSALRNILQTLKVTTRLVAFIIDNFSTDALPIARELGIPPYMFFTSNCFSLSLMLHIPTIYDCIPCEFRDLPNPLIMPGCMPLKGEDFFKPLQNRNNEACAWVVRQGRNFDLVEGILVNTFAAMESGVADCLNDRGDRKPAVWPVGPLARVRCDDYLSVGQSDCVKWLDRNPVGSVPFVCFGSGGTLSWEQTRELALGLQISGLRFLWVVRAPIDTDASGTYFNPSSSEPLGFLPDGFVDDTEDKGLLVSSWAPQVEVLCHEATGGFLSHCGWNSTLESVLNGVPMIAWPLYAEQRMTALMLVEEMKVALRPVIAEEGMVSREEVARVAKELIQGEEGKAARKRMQEMRVEAMKAVELGGSSYEALSEAVGKWKMGLDGFVDNYTKGNLSNSKLHKEFYHECPGVHGFRSY